MSFSPQDSSEPPQINRNVKIRGWRITIYEWTRNPHFLLWGAVVIIGLGIYLGRSLQPKEPEEIYLNLENKLSSEFRESIRFRDLGIELKPELVSPHPNMERVLAGLRNCDTSTPEAIAEVSNALGGSKLSMSEKQVSYAYWQSLYSHLGEPGADLLFLAYQVKPPRYANELIGDTMIDSGEKASRAVMYYQREIAGHPDAKECCRKMVAYYWSKQQIDELAALEKEPSYAAYFTPEISLRVAMKQRAWSAVWKPLLVLQKESFSSMTPIVLTSIAGGVWLLLAWQMIQAGSVFSFRFWIPLLAIAVGIFSPLPVLFLDVYQSEEWGMKQQGLFFEDAWFFIAGVGLREEVCKLLFFLPFVPVLLWRKSRLEMLVTAACVGLGFAILENVNYFRIGTPATAFARFLTANFLHFAATGLLGAALCDLISSPRKHYKRFLLTFIGVVIAHGGYDTFASAPYSPGWSSKVFNGLTAACFILLALAFFRQIAKERGPATDQFFPGATLVFGLSILTAAITICSSMEYGFALALGMLFVALIQVGVFGYMFFILLRDGLQEDEPEMKPEFEPL